MADSIGAAIPQIKCKSNQFRIGFCVCFARSVYLVLAGKQFLNLSCIYKIIEIIEMVSSILQIYFWLLYFCFPLCCLYQSISSFFRRFFQRIFIYIRCMQSNRSQMQQKSRKFLEINMSCAPSIVFRRCGNVVPMEWVVCSCSKATYDLKFMYRFFFAI